MTLKEKYNLLKDRYHRLSENPKNIKCPGVLRRLKRELRNSNI